MQTPLLARRMQGLQASPVREILKVLERPGMISFAGGLPSPDSFPEIGGTIPARYLQYGASEGETALREAVAVLLESRGLNCTPDQVLILSGSQQGIDLVGKLLVDNGDTIAIEYPTYLAALQVMGLYGARYQPVDEISNTTRLVYTIPTFQNPTGHCYTETERRNLARRCDEFNTILFEDDPYSDLVYDDVCRVPVCSILQNSSWIYQGSFSKSLSPGLRLGYMVCSSDLLPSLTRLKQAADLHSNRISQYFVLNLITASDYQNRLTQLQTQYRKKRDLFNQYLAHYLGHLAQWQIPPGGLFFWLTLNDDIRCDTRELFDAAIQQNVAFMPGQYFYPESSMSLNQLRLNFSHSNEQQMQEGLERLATLIEKSG